MSLIFHSVPFPITKIVELFVALLENFKISSESKTPVIFILTATYTTRPTFIDILLIMDTLLGTVTPKRELLFNKTFLNMKVVFEMLRLMFFHHRLLWICHCKLLEFVFHHFRDSFQISFHTFQLTNRIALP